MAEETSPGNAGAGQVVVDDVDELEQYVRPWDVCLSQLTRGRFTGRTRYVQTPDMLLYDERWLRRIKARGATPEGFIMLGTHVTPRRSDVDWCGKKLDHRRFACGGPSREIDFRTPDRSHHVVLLVRPNRLAGSLGAKVVDLLCGQKHIEFAPTDGHRLTVTMMTILREYATCSMRPMDTGEAEFVESSLLAAVGDCIKCPEANGKPEAYSRRQAAVRAAINHAERCAGRTSPGELAKAAGVSRRTLEYGFREAPHIAPSDFLRLHRINGARRELAAADASSSTVTRIALGWGFQHPGRFAVEFRRHFRHSPSEYLRRAPRPRTTRLLDLVAPA